MRLLKINLLILIAVIIFYSVVNLLGIAMGAYCSLSIGGITFICPLGFLQRPDLAGTTSCTILIGLTIIMAAILLIGRVFCGWICPMSVTLRISSSRSAENSRLHIFVFSASLVSLLLASWILGFPIFCLICPIGVVSRLIISALSGVVDLWSIAWGAVVLTAMILLIKARRWCNGMCPLGAVQTLLSPLKLMRIRVEHGCRKCDACAKACPLGLEIHEGRKIDQMSCTLCLKCVVICPFNALKLALVRPTFHKKA